MAVTLTSSLMDCCPVIKCEQIENLTRLEEKRSCMSVSYPRTAGKYEI